MVEFETIFGFFRSFGSNFPKEFELKLYHALSEQKRLLVIVSPSPPLCPTFGSLKKRESSVCGGQEGRALSRK